MKVVLVFFAALVIFFNTVPRINDTHPQWRLADVCKWLRFIGLVITATSSLLLCYAVSTPSGLYAAEVVTALLCGVALSWTFSPLVGNWLTFVFLRGGDDRYEALKRRKEDSA